MGRVGMVTTAPRVRPSVLLAHPGTQHAITLAGQLERHGLLSRFVGGALMHDRSALAGVLRRGAGSRRLAGAVSRRLVSGIAPERLSSHALIELGGQLATLLGVRPPTVYRLRNALFQQSIRERDLQRATIVVGFDTSSWILARRARDSGRRFVLDRTIGHPASLREMLVALRTRYPDWGASDEAKTDAEISLESIEHALADAVVVPSAFVAGTLAANGVDTSKVRVIPYGTDTSFFTPAEPGAARGPTTFLFAGRLSARKGVPVLLEAWRRLGARSARLQLAGAGELPRSALAALPAGVTLLGPLRRRDLREAFRRADVFVFPSLFEGQAIVQLEAAACGLPIIGTASSGADQIVQPGRTGLLVPPGDVEALAAAMESLITDPALRESMADAARGRVAAWNWDRYGDQWATLLQETAP